MDYPKRPPFFANKFCRLLGKTCAAQTIGIEAAYLLTTIVMTEDAAHYRRPVTFFSTQLISICGFGSESSLRRARDRAIAGGWLLYEPGTRRRPGVYCVQIPEFADSLDDFPVDEGREPVENPVTGDTFFDANVPQSTTPSPVTPFSTRMRRECDANVTALLPIPIPVPITKGASPPLTPGVVLHTDSPESTDSFQEFSPDGARATGQPKTTNSTNSHLVQQVNAHYLTHHPRSAKQLPSTSKEYRNIAARLREGFTVEQLCDAIDGCHRSRFHQGENDRGRKYDSLELITRSASHVNQFLEVPEDGGAILSETSRRTIAAGERSIGWMEQYLAEHGEQS